MASAGFNRSSDSTRAWASTADRANRMAMETAESMFGVQLKAFEQNLTATTSFFGQLARSQDADQLRQLLPQGAQLLRDNVERLADAHQRAVALGIKGGESWSELVQAHEPTAGAAPTGNSH